MFSALLGKEWRQLRALRLACLALGVVLPVAFLAGASAARRGLGPFGGHAGSGSTRTILLEVLPAALGMALWPLAALLLASQAFAGDRAAGVENFLLERPVPRWRTWIARFAASLLSTIGVAVGTSVVWVLFCRLAVAPSADEWSAAGKLLAAGLLLSGLAFLGAVGAAAVVAAPMQAVLLGLLLSIVPIALAFLLSTRFPSAAWHGTPLGLVLPWLLLPAYLVASHAALCRGEPEGKGRIARWAMVTAGGVAFVLALFFSVAPAVVRIEAARLEEGAVVESSKTGTAALAWARGGLEGGGGWILDLGTGARRTFLAPPLYSTSAWSPDGKMLAVLTGSEPFGGMSKNPRIEFYDDRGKRVGGSASFPESDWWQGLVWSGSRIVAAVSSDRKIGYAVVNPANGEVKDLGFKSSYWTLGLAGPTDDGRVFVARAATEPSLTRAADRTPEAQEKVPYALFRVDAESARLDATPVLRDSGIPWRAGRRLSPSGRYWLLDRNSGRCDVRPLLDLSTGKDVLPDARSDARNWLAGDALAWKETDERETWLLLARPGEMPKAVRRWSDLDVSLQVSPDRKLLLVEAFPRMNSLSAEETLCKVSETAVLARDLPVVSSPGTAVYDVARGTWTDLNPWRADKYVGEHWRRRWAGPRTLSRTGPGFLALEDLDRPGVVRDVIGHAE